MGSVLLVEDVNLKMGGRGEGRKEKKKNCCDIFMFLFCSFTFKKIDEGGGFI